jgi:WD40 repeat protein
MQGQEEQHPPLNEYRRNTTNVSWSPNGAFLAVAQHDWHGGVTVDDFVVTVVDAVSLTAFRTLSLTDLVSDLAWSSDGSRLFISTNSGKILQYRVEDSTFLSSLVHPRSQLVTPHGGISLHPAGRLLASSNTRGSIVIFDVVTNTIVAQITLEPNLSEFNRILTWIDWNARGDRLAIGGEGGFVRVYEWNEGTETFGRVFSTTDVFNPMGASPFAWNRDGTQIAVTSPSAGGTVKWDYLNNTYGQLLVRAFIPGKDSWRYSDNIFVALTGDQVVVLRDIVTNVDVMRYSSDNRDVWHTTAALSPRGQLAVGSDLDYAVAPPPLPNTLGIAELMTPVGLPARPLEFILIALCTLEPATTRNWRITNLNASEQSVTWQLSNSPTQRGSVTIPANGTYDFSTTVEAGNEAMRLIVNGQVVAEATGSAEPCGTVGS